MEAIQQGSSITSILPVLIPIIIWISVILGLAYIPANIARKKGYGFAGFYIFGVFLFIVALIVALCLSDKKQQLDEIKKAIYSERNEKNNDDNEIGGKENV